MQWLLEAIVSMIIRQLLPGVHASVLVNHLVLLRQLLEKGPVHNVPMVGFMRVGFHASYAHSRSVCTGEGASIEVGGSVLASLRLIMHFISRLWPRSWECCRCPLSTRHCIFLAHWEAASAIMVIGANTSLGANGATGAAKGCFHSLSIFITTNGHYLVILIALWSWVHWQCLVIDPVVILDACFHFLVIDIGILS